MKKTLGLLASLALLCMAGSALGGVLNVPGDFDEIHDAVQACPAGDTVQVAAGTYYDCTHETEGPESTPACVIMQSGVTLIGAGKEETIIDAEGLGRGIFVELVSNVRIENLQVRNAFADVYGAGILLREVDATVEMSDLKILHNTDGGIIAINQAHCVMRRIDFHDNEGKQGGGLAIEENSNSQVYDCYFTNNQSPSGGGIIIASFSNPTIDGCLIDANFINSNFGNGGGIAVSSATATITNCEIINNITLGYGGGVAWMGGASGTMSDCLVQGNQASYTWSLGAGIHTDGSDPLLENLTIVENDATGFNADGGGINVNFAPGPTIRGCTIADNSTGPGPDSHGGGITFQFGGDAIVERCIIAGSTVGQGLYCVSANPTISCSDVWGNAGGDALCGTDGGDNFSLDPMFCGAEDPDHPYGIDQDSPCAAGNHPGGPGTCGDELIGAGPEGCGTGVEESIPGAARLIGNAPNPFNPKTTIFFVLDRPGHASIRIYDVAGRNIANLHSGELPAGQHQVSWNGRHDDGRAAASGVYLYELEALSETHSRRMILVK